MMADIATLVGGLVSLIFGFACIGMVLIVALLVWALWPKRKQAIQTIQEIDFTDGIQAKEWSKMKEIFAKQSDAEIETAVKEKMVKAAGFEIEKK